MFIHRLLLTMFILLLSFEVHSEPEPTSPVKDLLGRLEGTWVAEGASRHGADTRTEIVFRPGPSSDSWLGESTTFAGGAFVYSGRSLMVFHPDKRRWIYLSVNSKGFVQEGEELRSDGQALVFKGTAYRNDGTGQTSFVWTLEVTDADTYRSESEAYHQGEWRPNPPLVFKRVKEESTGAR